MKLTMRLPITLILTVLLAGLVSAQDTTTTTNATDSSSSTGLDASVVDTSAVAEIKRLAIEAMSVEGGIGFLIILILIVIIVVVYKRWKASEEAREKQNRRASVALDSTTTPAAAGSNANDLHAVIVGVTDDMKDPTNAVDAAVATPKAGSPSTSKTTLGKARRASGSRPAPVSTSHKQAGSQPPSPSPQVVTVRRPSLKGTASPVPASPKLPKGHPTRS